LVISVLAAPIRTRWALLGSWARKLGAVAHCVPVLAIGRKPQPGNSIHHHARDLDTGPQRELSQDCNNNRPLPWHVVSCQLPNQGRTSQSV